MDGAISGTIVGGLLGFLAAILPRLLELIEAYFRGKKELQGQAQEIDAATKGVVFASTANRKIIVPVEGEVIAPGVPADEDYVASAEEQGEEPVVVAGPTFFERLFSTLRESVRPTITYGFFVMFLFIKLKGFHEGMFVDHTPAVELLPVIWDEGTESLFAAILAFWFGTRAFEKSRALLGKQEQVVP